MVSKQEKVKKQWSSLQAEVSLDGTKAVYDNNILSIEGPKGVNSKKLKYPNVAIKIESDKIIIETQRLSQAEKKIIFTYKAHIKNMIKGVKEGFEYNLKVVFAKFPMTVELKGEDFIVKNLLGEKVPRTIKIPTTEVKVDVKGANITVNGIDKEKTGQVAASIEQMCRITHLDRRVVQDGIYITKKPHVEYV